MLSFKQYLQEQKELIEEGGNVTITSTKGEKKEAQRLDLTKNDRTKFAKIIKDGLEKFNKANGIWSKQLFDSNKFLSGSAFHFFDKSIPDTKFKTIKPTVGDIDCQADESKTEEIQKILDASIDKQYGNLELIGYKKSAGQFITLWGILENGNYIHNIQIDFELVPFENGFPTEWAQFSHSSSMEDLAYKIKGVFAKKLYSALTAKNLKDIDVIKTSRGKESIETKKSTQLAFAVTHGLREKYKTVERDGKQVYQEVPVKDSKYIQNINEMLNKLFDLPDNHKFTATELKDAGSFVGTIKLIKKYATKEEQQNIFNGFLNSLVLKGAQRLYKGKESADEDRKEKFTAIDYMSKELGTKIPENLKSEIEQYYNDYV